MALTDTSTPSDLLPLFVKQEGFLRLFLKTHSALTLWVSLCLRADSCLVVSFLPPLTVQLWNYSDPQKRICTHGRTENVEFMGIKAGLSLFAYGYPEQHKYMSINSRWLQEKTVLLRIISGIHIILNQNFRTLGACEQNMLRNGKECFLS